MAINEATLINAATNAALISAEAVSEARKNARRDRLSVLDTIGRDHRLPRTVMFQAVAQQRSLQFMPLAKLTPDEALLAQLPTALLTRRLIVPLNMTEKKAGQPLKHKPMLAMADPDDQVALDTLKRLLPEGFNIALAEPISLHSVLQRYLQEGSSGDTQDPVQLFDDLMKEAYVCNASDIHLKPEKTGLTASLRVDGRLIPYPKLLNVDEAHLLINRVKVLASLDISEQRVPQDGGFNYEISDWKIAPFELRVATLPSRWGERVTLRILGQESDALALDALALNPHILKHIKDVLTYPHGMVLVTGPTGSGKSTTLYATLREIDRTTYNVLTVEDPIEQQLDDATQVQVGVKIDFAKALRSFLRHDPDIILVGEIRDHDTAETAMKAAMTGHLVLSTLHTNNATSTVNRLRNLDCENFLIATTLRLVLAQRLVRKLCHICKRAIPTPEEYLPLIDASTLYEPQGCPACMNTGYKGRIALHEMFWVDAQMGQCIADGADDQSIRQSASPEQLYTLWQDALYKVAEGSTSLAEVLPFAEQTLKGFTHRETTAEQNQNTDTPPCVEVADQ